jgi:hypothetical protein
MLQRPDEERQLMGALGRMLARGGEFLNSPQCRSRTPLYTEWLLAGLVRVPVRNRLSADSIATVYRTSSRTRTSGPKPRLTQISQRPPAADATFYN